MTQFLLIFKDGYLNCPSYRCIVMIACINIYKTLTPVPSRTEDYTLVSYGGGCWCCYHYISWWLQHPAHFSVFFLRIEMCQFMLSFCSFFSPLVLFQPKLVRTVWLRSPSLHLGSHFPRNHEISSVLVLPSLLPCTTS